MTSKARPDLLSFSGEDLKPAVATAQRYYNPIEHERMDNGLCPECGMPPAVHVNDVRFWIPRHCDLLPVGVEQRIAQYRSDRQETLSTVADPSHNNGATA